MADAQLDQSDGRASCRTCSDDVEAGRLVELGSDASPHAAAQRGERLRDVAAVAGDVLGDALKKDTVSWSPCCVAVFARLSASVHVCTTICPSILPEVCIVG